MKKKNLFPIILLLVIIVVAIVSILTTSIEKVPQNNDYTPEEEISDKSLKETTINLYFVDSNTQNLKSEARLVNANELLENPYKTIVQYLIEGPKSDTLQNVFPENTKILNATIKGACVTLNFSNELLNYSDETQKYNIINCILNSLSQLTEVNSFKIQINGNTSDLLNEEYVRIY